MEIRYKARVCADKERIERLLSGGRVGVLGLNAGDYPYAVPLNYIWRGGCVYFHGAGSGKRVTLLDESPRVCFTVYEEYGTVKDDVPWHADTAYLSAMVFGRAERVRDSEEAAAVLQQLVEKFMPGFFSNSRIAAAFVEKYRSSLDGNPVAVFRVKPDEITAKENRAEPENLFQPGMKKRGGAGGEG
jgi:nitroimidazol reductase NimA-like FMN-containing flavoprotein (pyridoxamine 5'-phosphate oxidase superfamily)